MILSGYYAKNIFYVSVDSSEFLHRLVSYVVGLEMWK